METINRTATSLINIGAKGAPKKICEHKLETNSTLIIIENKVYEESIIQLLKKIKLKENVNIRCSNFAEEADRENNLQLELKLNILSGHYSQILCIADGDETPRIQFDRLIQILKELEYDIPNCQMDKKGTIIKKSGKATIGIWIMPNNKDKGTYADFYLTSALIDNKLRQNIDDVLSKNKQNKLVKYKKTYDGAAKYFTYLAWQKNPTRSDKTLYTDKTFNTETQLFTQFKNWITTLLR